MTIDWRAYETDKLWDELITRATGESLTPRYFVEEFVEQTA